MRTSGRRRKFIPFLMVSRSFNHTSLLELERRKWMLVTDGVHCVSALFVATVIVENGVRLRLNIVDTPGYGDQVNNDNWSV